MIEAFRVTEADSSAWPTRATQDAEQAEVLDALIERTKPVAAAAGWHRLLAAPFRYPVPAAQAYEARFRPPYFDRNVLYSSAAVPTAAYEASFHFMRQRRHLPGYAATEERVLFSLHVVGKVLDIRRRRDIGKIMDRADYSASHAFVKSLESIPVISYPSCRDPERGANFAVFDIRDLGKRIGGERTLTMFFDRTKDALYFRELALTVKWAAVA